MTDAQDRSGERQAPRAVVTPESIGSSLATAPSSCAAC